MPTYEYQCSDCSYTYEVFHKISLDPLTQCPKCRKDTLKRCVGGKNAVLNFKGSGFYITDYGKNPEQKPSKESSDNQ
ncbi:MAG: hypothetical protein S4CHLAM6_03740 [Chlamydiae bacterium]|nr:hypothetical protein [Chlamydiota bacterium]